MSVAKAQTSGMDSAQVDRLLDRLPEQAAIRAARCLVWSLILRRMSVVPATLVFALLRV